MFRNLRHPLLALAGAAALAAAASACRGAPPVPDREPAYRANNRGVALLEQFRYPEAADAFREALRIDGSLAIARLNLSLALLYALDFEGAEREAAEAARLMPSAPEPPYVLGLLARAGNRPADARRAFARVREIDPADVGTAINLGQIALEERQYPEALELLGQASAAEPYNVTAAYNLGLALTRSGQTEAGRRELGRAQELRGTGYAVTYGTGYLEQGRYAEAISSTGAEPELVDEAVPAVSLTPEPLGPPWNPIAGLGSPFGRRYGAADLTQEGMRAIAAALGGGVTLLDVEGDGDLDVFAASAAGQRLFRNDGGKGWTDVTEASGLAVGDAGPVPIGCVAGDFDNDGSADLFVPRFGGSHALYRNDGAGRFSDVTATARLPAYPFLPGAAAMADVDHDGDLDLLVAGLADLRGAVERAARTPLAFPGDFAPAPLQLLRNNGDGTFADITTAARLTSASHAIAVVPTDFDNRRDVDLLVISNGAIPQLFQNLRDGTFRDVAADVGLGDVGPQPFAAVAAADVNKDDFPDFFLGRAGGGLLAMSDGRGRFTIAEAPAGADAARAAQFLDYDNDGLLDLVTWSESRPRIARNLGRRWEDVTPSAAPGGRAPAAAARGLASADLDGDGATDLIAGDPSGLAMWRNSGSGAAGRRSVRVHLRGRVSNRLGIGSKIQLRAGSLKGRLETSAATPAAAPADLVFGLGRRAGADVARVLWPSGILQAEALQPPGDGAPAAPLAIEELDRKPSSCPFLFTWNGDRFEFVTDFLGAGEMGYWAGPGAYHRPDPLEYVRIRGDQLRPREGQLELRVTNELEEALFVDRLELLAIAHPPEVEVYPNEGMTDPPKPFRLFAVAGTRAPRATDDRGRDVTDRISRLDRRYVDDFPVERLRGYARRHGLTLDLAPVGDAPVLLLTGWTDYAFSSDNVAAHHAGLALAPPSLQIRDRSGRWRTAIADIGIPVGRPQTVPVDLSSVLRPGEHEVRIVTTMRIYWDQVSVGHAVPAEGRSGSAPSRGDRRSGRFEGVPAGLIVTRLEPREAFLRDRGFSEEIRPGGVGPAGYRYDRVTPASPWKAMTGMYTREGDVLPLVRAADDMFVIAKPGDEIAIVFEDAAPPDAGWTRTFLLVSDGYSKEMDINSASPDTVEPLPFRAMTGYPYPAPQRYPATSAHQEYRDAYNTRAVRRSIPSIDSVASNREEP